MAKDPICGMHVEESGEALKTSRKGTTFYFCSDTCLLTFVAPEKEIALLRRLTVLSFALGVPVFLLTWFVALPNPLPQNVVLFALATPVQLVAGSMFYRGTWHALRARVANMDTLIAVGTSAAWLYSAVVTFVPGFFPEGTYYDVSSLIIGFILLGKLLEHEMRGRASDSVRKLLNLNPKNAVVIRGSAEVTVPVEELQVGDVMVVRPGDGVPTDGVITEGQGALDEKMLTGESIPVDKAEGDEVFGGTINRDGHLRVRATKVGSDTTLSQIVKLVEAAQAAQAPIQRVADRVASYFVPIVVLIAVGSLLFWYMAGAGALHGFTAFIAVLIIACPCALGLATPAAIVVGTGKGASNGILVKGGEVLEKAKNVDVVVLDKTGTVTKGEPELVDLVPLSGFSEGELLRLAASVESGSEHPVGLAVVRAANERGISLGKPEAFRAEPGLGVRADLEGSQVMVGSRRLLAGAGVGLGEAEAVVSKLEAEGKTAVVVAAAGRVAGVLAVEDTVKTGAKEAVAALKELGLRVTMLTGDNGRTARAIAAEVGIDDVEAEVLPAQKSEAIARLKGEGHVVAMVGDGINDAPALAGADLGIAIGSGTDVAIETAGIVLIRSDLRDVAGAIRLSRATMSKIRQNLFWAFAYNTVLIPVAASGFLNPILAGVAMALSSVSVVGNSLSLNRTRLGR
ncbi:MAG: heavy metal translocating P-type ATPase [Thaumarchaeota archaeon]|nr:heavy metal translocating P-type ATPase [Nitrososphaerota archaeon]